MAHVATLGEMIDEYYTTREARLKLDRESERLKIIETDLKDVITASMKHKTIGSIDRGKKAQAKINFLDQPPPSELVHWPEVYEYILRGNTDILERRLAVGALRVRWQQGLIVPGVEKLILPNVTIGLIQD